MRFSLSLVYFSKRISTAKAISVSQGGSTKGCCCCCSIFNVKCWMLIRERLLAARYSRRVVQVYSPHPLLHPEALHNICLLWRRAWGVSIEPYTIRVVGSECVYGFVADFIRQISARRSVVETSHEVEEPARICGKLLYASFLIFRSSSLVSSFDTFLYQP